MPGPLGHYRGGGFGGRRFGGFRTTVVDYGMLWPVQPVIAIEAAPEKEVPAPAKKTDTSLTGALTVLAAAVIGIAIYKLIKS